MSTLSDLFDGCAEALEGVEERALDLIEESYPSTAVELLPEYEAELDLDSTGTIAERQARVHALVIARPRYRPIDFQTALASLLGQLAANVVVIENRIWKLTKTGGTNGAWDAGASSVQSIAGNGVARFICGTPASSTQRMLGLTDIAPTHSFDIKWALYLGRTGSNSLDVYQSGSSLFATTYAAGDTLEIRRVGTTITYWQNGVLIYTSLVTTAGVLVVDTSFLNSNTEIDGIRLYDGTIKAFKAITWQTITNVTPTLNLSADVREVFRFFIFRDPALGGTWDVDSAQDLVDTLKASHTLGFVIESTTALYESAYTLYERDVMGE